MLPNLRLLTGGCCTFCGDCGAASRDDVELYTNDTKKPETDGIDNTAFDKNDEV